MAVTFTEKEHNPLAAIVPPDMVTVLVPCVAVMAPLPQEPVRPFGVEMTRPEGSVSLKATPDRLCVAFGLLIVKLSEVEPASGMLPAPKALLIAGGPTTVMEAVEVFPGPVCVEVTLTLLFFTPAVVP